MYLEDKVCECRSLTIVNVRKVLRAMWFPVQENIIIDLFVTDIRKKNIVVKTGDLFLREKVTKFKSTGSLNK
ncbi:Hypothetical predicted protein [Octopus vulgaris]|uniref:Uncharacterized protein n=1 Tax=Octopus vulgaris TaxID=6645 RepID=A0AA36BLF3_OCTVU|nr:Hypothetical predicted protein [Octopus vulgaris]